MFVVELIYKADLGAIDGCMKAHMAFLTQHYKSGRFLVSGRKVPRDGGIIIAVGDSREQIQTLMAEDPFVREGLVELRIIEFCASQHASDLQERVDADAKAQVKLK